MGKVLSWSGNRDIVMSPSCSGREGVGIVPSRRWRGRVGMASSWNCGGAGIAPLWSWRRQMDMSPLLQLEGMSVHCLLVWLKEGLGLALFWR